MDYCLHPQLEHDCFPVGHLPMSQVLMMNDCQYPWFILVPRRGNVREIYELSALDQACVWHEVSWLGEQLMQRFDGHKLNVGALGNMVPQLHIHLIVRQQTDIAWPRPIWGTHPAKRYTKEAAGQRVDEVAAMLAEYRT